MSSPSNNPDSDGRLKLKLGDEIHLKHQEDPEIKTRISGFPMFGEGPDSPIVAVTGGPGKIDGNAETVTGDKVGPIVFARNGLVFIGLDDDYRSNVENCVISDNNILCHISIHEGPLSRELVLAHAGGEIPLKLRIEGSVKNEEGCFQPYLNIESLPLGTLITKRAGENNSRILPAFGPVCGQEKVCGKPRAVISRIDEGIRAFKRETNDERFRSNKVKFVTPICQPESDEEEAAGPRNVDVDGGEDGIDSGPASSESGASLSRADLTEGAIALGGASGRGNQDQVDTGYGSRAEEQQ